ncbi:hypothetical protein [Prochlorococcus marinus]|nr:hypothetical protein [Prochlorococcus marinus]
MEKLSSCVVGEYSFSGRHALIDSGLKHAENITATADDAEAQH